MSLACITFGVGTSSDARRLELLERAVTVALSPLEFSDFASWGQALTSVLCTVAGASSGAVLLPDAAHRWRAVSLAARTDGPEHSTRVHEEATERLFDSSGADAVLWARDDLSPHDAELTTPWTASTIGIRVRASDGSIAVVYVCRDRTLGPVPPHVIAALRAVAPAFRAGISARAGSARSRSNIARMLDTLADAALLFDAAGEVLHVNPAAERLTRSTDATRLRGEAQRIAFSVGATARRIQLGVRASSESIDPAVRTVRIGTTVYQLRGTVVSEQLLAAEPAVLVTVTASQAEPLTDDALHASYGLTTREIQVARLLAAGLSNNEIADHLGVRFFTARNHVERTLAKLGVTSRHRVGPLLRNDARAEVGLTSAA